MNNNIKEKLPERPISLVHLAVYGLGAAAFFCMVAAFLVL
jgi:hypothetical protein